MLRDSDAHDDADPEALPTLAQGHAALCAPLASGTSPPAGPEFRRKATPLGRLRERRSPDLSPAFSNPDVEPELAPLPALERAFIGRQIERTHRDLYPDDSPHPWTLAELSVAPLTKYLDRSDRVGIVLLEVPVFTNDRSQAILRGQRHPPTRPRALRSAIVDFEHWLQRRDGRWILT